MENELQNLVIKCTQIEDTLLTTIRYFKDDKLSTYKTQMNSGLIDLNIVKTSLEEQMYTVMSLNENLIQLKTKGGVIITAEKEDSNMNQITTIIEDQFAYHLKTLKNSLITPDKSWKLAGVVQDIEAILVKYPVLQYAYGSFHNNRTIEEITITGWNRGIRVFFPRLILHGDNATNFHSGTAMFTRDTDDIESKSNFYHRYVNSDFKPCCGSNGVKNDLKIYVRKL